jgi:hypothetical protein
MARPAAQTAAIAFGNSAIPVLHAWQQGWEYRVSQPQ